MKRADPLGLFVLNPFHQLGRRCFVGGGKHRPQRQQLPKCGPQAIDVAAAIEPIDRQHLFGAGVAQRADELPRAGKLILIGPLRETEIHEHGLRTIGRDHDIARLDVAMDDAHLVQFVGGRAT